MGWMGPGNHEGWIVPLFADGAEGTGCSGSDGVQVNLGDGAEWRPDAAVVGYAAGCECGWRGQPWTRVPSGKADPDARLLATSGDFYDLDEPDEDRVIEDWRDHVEPHRAVEAVEQAAERAANATSGLDEAVGAARRAGASWANIGRAAGMTRQSANERWASRV